MKKVILAIFAAAILFTAFTVLVEKDKAIVNQKEGLYVFMLSKPVSEYQYLGSVKKTIAWSGKPEEMLNSMIKKVKNDYPNANGIIFTDIAMDEADAIYIKD